jgi:hypothetical protein
VLTRFQRLPEGTKFLTLVFKDISLVTSAASVNECLTLLLALDPKHLKLSLDEWTELTIFGLTTIVVQGLLSFHHFENLGHRIWGQHTTIPFRRAVSTTCGSALQSAAKSKRG